MSGKGKHIFTSALSGYLRFITSIVILWFLTPFIIKHIGIDDFGLWTLVFSVIGIYELLDLGFANGVIKYVARYDALQEYHNRNQLLSTILFAYCLLALIGMSGIILLSFFFNDLLSIPTSQEGKSILLLILIAIRALIFGLPASLFRGILFGDQKIAITNAIISASVILNAILVFIAMSLGYNVVALAIALLLSFFLETIAYIFFCFKLVPNLSLSWSLVDLSRLKELASFCIMQCVANISSQLIHRTDPIIIKLFMSIFYVSIYAIPLRIVTYVYQFINQFTNVLSPFIAHLDASRKHIEIRSLFLDCSKYALCLATLFFVVGSILAENLILVWLGDQFLLSVTPLIILLGAMWFNSSYIVAGQVLAMSGHHMILTKFFFITAIIHLLLSVALIYPLGINGVALATLLTALIGFFMNNKWVCDHFDAKYEDYFKKAIIPLIFPGAALWIIVMATNKIVMPTNLIMLIVTPLPGIAAYMIIFWFFALNLAERETFSRILKSTLKSQ
jgi:O-antigen/teichoic acid export membrane protein